jgi:hypothetical protein
MNLSAERGREPRDRPVQFAYSGVAVFSDSLATFYLCISLGRGGERCTNPAASVIAIAGSFVWLYIHSTPQDVEHRH